MKLLTRDECLTLAENCFKSAEFFRGLHAKYGRETEMRLAEAHAANGERWNRRAERKSR